MPASWSVIERELFSLVACLLRFHHLRAVFVLDRGYADIEVIRYFTIELHAHFIIRALGNVYVHLPGYAGRRSKLGRIGEWEAVSYYGSNPSWVNLAVFRSNDRYGKDELACLVTDLPADQA
jgi:hypothetical protein